MKRLFFFVLGIFSVISGGHSRSETSLASLTSRIDDGPNLIVTPPTDSLVKFAPNTRLYVAQDGMVYLVELNSREILWSFKSGPPLHASSYALDSYSIDERGNYISETAEFLLEYGEDGNLYKLGPNNTKVKIELSAEEFFNRAPFVADGFVLMGSKNTTVFLVDPQTGKIIHRFNSGERQSEITHPNTGKVIHRFNSGEDQSEITLSAEEKTIMLEDDFKKLFKSLDSMHKDQSLYILRKDYTLSYLSSKTKNCLWNLTFSVIEVSSQGQERKESTELTFNSINVVVPKIYDYNLLKLLLKRNELPFPSLPGVKSDGNDFTLSEMQFGTKALPTEGYGKPVTSTFGLKFWNGSFIWGLLVFINTAIGIFCLRKLGKGRAEKNVKVFTVKKKKSRKSGMKNSLIIDKSNENTLKLRSLSNHIDEGGEFYRIGNFLISNKEIAKGSNGTVILEGIHDGRQVAIKRLVQSHYGVAEKEIQNLIVSDCHPNIVRLFGFEYDQYFAYLSLERCACNLSELIFLCLTPGQNQDSREDQEQKMKQFQDIELWKPNGQPSVQLLKLLRDIVCGLAHLHELGIVHRDLKPQNILIVNERSLSAKISDMGISKRLPENTASLTQSTTGLGSSGWKAPEQLNHGRHTQAIDLFSLGCIFFFCLTGGKHPYGDIFERDSNILYGRKDLFLLESNPEATDLIDHLLDPKPDLRPKALQVLHHPFFWNSDKRISFLCEASDRVELENRENESEVLDAVESISYNVFGCRWDDRIDGLILDDIGRYRRYSYNSIRDLLRIIRNKHNHYRALSTEVEEILGPIPDGFDNYFSTRFPNLIMGVYKVLLKYCIGEASFKKYFEPSF